ncbi:MAG: hypothetical protein NWS71_06180 [Opitutales bacterium]|nr:hypothetical protein [Opitutales bacterium]MDP4777041.1 hypothetical protein [Opitutales bacterium]
MEKDPFDEFHHISFQSISDKYLYPIRIKSILKGITNADTLYVALYRNISSHIINTIQPNKVIIYDDGNRTLSATDRIFRKKQPEKFRTRAILARLLGRRLDLQFTKTATYFSLYDLPQVPPENYIKNDYQYYKKTVSALPVRDSVDFLGSKVIGYGINEKIFEALMQQIVSFYHERGRSLRYITHRSEPLDYLEKVAEKLGFELVNLPNIIEVAYAQSDTFPCEIATLRTAAVSNLHTIFNLPVRVFEMPQEQLATSAKKDLQGIYQNFREQGFKLETLELC